MTVFEAPFPFQTVSVVLPNAEFGDSSASKQSVDLKRTMGGQTYTYVKSSERREVTLPFELSRMKAIELREFVRIYLRAHLLITLHDGSRWVAQFLTSPFPFSADERAGGWPGGELVSITLDLAIWLESDSQLIID